MENLRLFMAFRDLLLKCMSFCDFLGKKEASKGNYCLQFTFFSKKKKCAR